MDGFAGRAWVRSGMASKHAAWAPWQCLYRPIPA